MILTWTTLLSSVVWQGRLSARIIFILFINLLSG